MREPSLIRFGVFELDGRTGELRKHGVRLKIQDQPFQVLQALLERPGELVTREELQRRIWPQDTFVDFDQSLNRAINKVRDVLNDAAGAPRFVETLPRRGYRFIAPVNEVPISVPGQPSPQPQTAAVRSFRKLGWVAASFLTIAGAGAWLARDREALPPPRLIPLTTLTGNELFPAFSPDGKQVAFTWNGDSPNNPDLYVKVVGDVTPLRLTSEPGGDGFPAWSPDGSQIAFTSQRDGGSVFVVSPVGGPQRKLAGFATVGRPSWSSDGKYLLVARQHVEKNPEPGDGALFLAPVASVGDPRPVLTPPPGTWYRNPVYAPDGRSLAFESCTGHFQASTCTLMTTGLRDGLVPEGDARRIQPANAPTLGLVWTRDGSSLIFGRSLGEIGRLWRVNVRNPREAEPVELAGTMVAYPALDFKGGRLAFQRSISNVDIWRLERGGKPAPFLTSSLIDGNSQYSRDGQRIAFSSSRQGDREIIAIWVANADGTGVTQITRINSPRCGSPRWSPGDGWIAFDAWGKDGGWDVWVVKADGGSPKQLTHGPADNAIPSWSHDGSWIYFTSKRSGRFEVWRVPTAGGTEEQITRNGGYVAIPSTDGKTLYYTVSQAGTEGIYAKRLPDGDERQVVKEQVAMRGLAVFDDGLYYLHYRGKNIYEIRFHELATSQDQVIAEVEGDLEGASGLGVSPDRKTFLFTKVLRSGVDLMMIENFR